MAQGDFADADAVTRMIGRAEPDLGFITILANTADVGSGGPARSARFALLRWPACAR